MNDQSQVQYGPFFLSFGDLHRQINRAKKAFKLTGDEFLILQCFIQAQNRPGYKSHLNDVIYYDIEYWQTESGLIPTHIYRAFRGLGQKNVLLALGAKGKNQRHFLHPNFVQLALDKKVAQYVCVDKAKNSDQSGHTTQTNLVTVSDQSGHTTQTNLVTVSDQSGHSALYIEDSLLIPKDSLPIPRSIPAVDNVDNFTAQERRLSNWYDENELEKARTFIGKLKGSQLGRLDEFLDFLDNDWRDELGTKGMNLIWAKWSLGEMTKTNPLRIISNAPQGELGAL